MASAETGQRKHWQELRQAELSSSTIAFRQISIQPDPHPLHFHWQHNLEVSMRATSLGHPAPKELTCRLVGQKVVKSYQKLGHMATARCPALHYKNGFKNFMMLFLIKH